MKLIKSPRGPSIKEQRGDRSVLASNSKRSSAKKVDGRSSTRHSGARKSWKRSSSQSSAIYAGFVRRGSKFATLEDVLDPAVETKTLEELSHPQLVRLILARLRSDESFIPLRMLGTRGVIDRSRAIQEIAASSSIGLHLMNIEKEYIRLQLKRRQLDG
jgi:hypothetical protein